MAKRHRILAPCLAAALALNTTGCWDRVEINNRGFVAGVSIDAASASEDEEGSEAGAPNRICYQIVVPSGQKGISEGSKSGPGYSNLCGESASLSAFHQLATDKLSRPPFYDHLKVIIVSERVAREGTRFADALDFFMRTSGIRRSIKIMIAKGEASRALDVESPNERLPASDIEKIAGNRTSLEKPPATTIGYIHERFMNEWSFAVQALETSGKSILVAGCAVFDGKTNREAGELSARQTAGMNFLRGHKLRGTLTIQSAEARVSLNINEIRSRMRADVRDPAHIVFDVFVDVVVFIRESAGAIDLTKPSVIGRIQTDAESEIAGMIDDAVQATKLDIRKDALGLGDHLQQRHYRTWGKISDDWDHGKYLLTGCEVRPHVSVSVRQTGIVDQSVREQE